MQIGLGWLFVTNHNRWRLFAFAAGLLLPALFIFIPTIWHWSRESGHPHPGWSLPSGIGHWNNFMPIAQFAAAVSLAYLALESFRHVNHTTKLLDEKFTNKTSEDIRSLLLLVQAKRREEAAQGVPEEKRTPSYELNAVLKLLMLCHTRRAWLNNFKTIPVDDADVDRKKAVSAAVSNAKSTPWFFEKEPGRAFVSPFYTGADQLTMAGSLGLSMLIHLLATVESFTPLYAPDWLLTWQVSWGITAIQFLLGILWPLYYVLVGRHVVERVAGIVSVARLQADVLEKVPLDALATATEQLKPASGSPPPPQTS